jgi:hypothetical protein
MQTGDAYSREKLAELDTVFKKSHPNLLSHVTQPRKLVLQVMIHPQATKDQTILTIRHTARTNRRKIF